MTIISWRFWRRFWPGLGLLALSACVPPQPTSLVPPPLPGPPPGAQASFYSLPGWQQDNQANALAAFVQGCKALTRMPPDEALGGTGMAQAAGGQAGLWLASCTAAQAIPPGDTQAARSFFETNFTVYAVPGQSQITGYFEPEYLGAKNLGRGYTIPLYAQPADEPLATLPRAAIDAGALTRKAPVTAYLTNPADAFMLQIYGSGRVLLPNGRTLRVAFDGENKQPYTPIGKILVSNGYLAPDDVSFQSISAWLTAHPALARPLMEQDENYVFLKPVGSLPDNLGAPGALRVPITAGRTLAIGRIAADDANDKYKSVIPLNTPVFLSTTDPAAHSPINILTIAQDTDRGLHDLTAAKLFFGGGPDAETAAGTMHEPGQLYILLPNPPAP